MVPSLSSIKDTWETTTNYDSTALQLLVAVAAAVLGGAITWELSDAWEQLFGYSSLMTVLTTFIVFFTIYFCLSYAVARTSIVD
jgi:sterol desaturase/sphingolipid hydroxylase (fatty acid hydroxylase superfamily)